MSKMNATLRHIAELPIMSVVADILGSLAQVVLVDAPTGSGKTVGLGVSIVRNNLTALFCEPLIYTCESTAEYVAQAVDSVVGGSVGLLAGDTDMPGTSLTYCTTVVQRYQQMARVGGYDLLVLDEYHERKADQDALLGLAIRGFQTGTNPFNKLIICSATLDVDTLAKWITGQGVSVEIVRSKGRSFPIHIEEVGTIQEGVSVAWQMGHSVLVFQPGEAEIEQTCELLRKQGYKRVAGYYGRMDRSEKRDALESFRSAQSILVASDALATGATLVPPAGITLSVVDSGLARQRVTRFGVSGFETVPASRALMTQRAGRTGRVSDGYVWQVRSASERPAGSTPEIQKTGLGTILLQTLQSGVDLAALPLFESPGSEVLEDARRELLDLGLIEQGSEGYAVTQLGSDAARLSLSPRRAVMLLRAIELGCGGTMLDYIALAESGGLRGRRDNPSDLPRVGEDWLEHQSRLMQTVQHGADVEQWRLAITQLRRSLGRDFDRIKRQTGSLDSVRRAWAAGYRHGQYGVLRESGRRCGVKGEDLGKPFALPVGTRLVFERQRIQPAKGGAPFIVLVQPVRLDEAAAAEIAPIQVDCVFHPSTYRFHESYLEWTHSWGTDRITTYSAWLCEPPQIEVTPVMRSAATRAIASSLTVGGSYRSGWHGRTNWWVSAARSAGLGDRVESAITEMVQTALDHHFHQGAPVNALIDALLEGLKHLGVPVEFEDADSDTAIVQCFGQFLVARTDGTRVGFSSLSQALKAEQAIQVERDRLNVAQSEWRAVPMAVRDQLESEYTTLAQAGYPDTAWRAFLRRCRSVQADHEEAELAKQIEADRLAQERLARIEAERTAFRLELERRQAQADAEERARIAESNRIAQLRAEWPKQVVSIVPTLMPCCPLCGERLDWSVLTTETAEDIVQVPHASHDGSEATQWSCRYFAGPVVRVAESAQLPVTWWVRRNRDRSSIAAGLVPTGSDRSTVERADHPNYWVAVTLEGRVSWLGQWDGVTLSGEVNQWGCFPTRMNSEIRLSRGVSLLPRRVMTFTGVDRRRNQWGSEDITWTFRDHRTGRTYRAYYDACAGASAVAGQTVHEIMLDHTDTVVWVSRPLDTGAVAAHDSTAPAPAQPAKPVAPAAPAQPAKPVAPAAPAQPAKPVAPAAPARSTHGSRPSSRSLDALVGKFGRR